MDMPGYFWCFFFFFFFFFFSSILKREIMVEKGVFVSDRVEHFGWEGGKGELRRIISI